VMIRGVARAADVSIGRGEPGRFLQKVEEAELPEELKQEIAPLLEVLRTVQTQIEDKETELVELAQRDETLRLLATAPGVGLIVAATYVSVIDDAHRFRNAQAVGSYLGLAPSEDTTGGPNKRRIGGISKHGNSMCRAMLVEAAWQVLRSKNTEDPLYSWAMHIKEKRSGKVAAIALARKLSLVLYAMWRDNTVYDQVKEARARIRGMRRDRQDAVQRAVALEQSVKKFERRRKKGSSDRTTGATA
jgi:transposase